jgi:phytanoyl-CoA hydroxylase
MTEFTQNLDQFSDDGFINLKGFLSPSEVEELEHHLQQYIHNIVPKLPPTDAFYEVEGKPETLKQLQAMGKHDPFFYSLAENSKFSALAEKLLGGKVTIKENMQFFNKPARIGKETPPHQDGYYFCLLPSEAVTLWLPLDKIAEENGCIRYVRGSHKKGIRPHNVSNILGFSQGIADWNEADDQGEVKVLAEPGDLLAHHCDIIHRAGENTSPRSRRALAIVFKLASTVEDTTALKRYLDSATQQRLKIQAK